MASRTNSVSEVFFSDDEFSPHLQNLYSPISNFSINSQELNRIHTPQRMCSQDDGDDEDDYSHIQLPPNRLGSKIPPEPPVRTSSVSSVMSDYSQRSYPMAYEHERNYNYGNYTLQHPHQYYHQQSRRKTWSPTGLKLSMSGNYTGQSRNCSSSEILDNNKMRKYGSIIYEDQERGPPKLAPVSGMLSKSPAKGIIKPIAFKPVVINTNNYINKNNDSYTSHDNHVTGAIRTHQSPQSIHMESERSSSISNGSSKNFSPDRPDIFSLANVSRVSSNHMDGYVGTPSPSDSGVGELEAILREKDAEINTLREVMDKNERAIFQVYDEKKKSWVKEIHDIKADYDQKLKTIQRKAYKTEQVLSLQSYKAQQELKSVQIELEKVKAERDNLKKKSDWVEDRYSELMSLQGRSSSQSSFDVADLQQKVDDLNSSLIKQNEDMQLLQFKLQEKECEIAERENELSKTFKEVISKTEEVKSLKANLRRVSGDSDLELMDSSFCSCDKEIQTELRNTVSSPISCRIISPASSDSQSDMSTLRKEILEIRQTLQTKTELFEKEREQWKDEKNKVIRYQKQLQLNYLQMFNKNRMLEAEVEQLTLDLENRDLKLMAINGGEESMC